MLHVSLLCSSLIIAPPRAAPRRAEAAQRVRDSVMHASPTRRELLQLTASGMLSAELLPLPALADDNDVFEVVVPQPALLANLASAPVRNIVVTGASSGVGLAGAKLFVVGLANPNPNPNPSPNREPDSNQAPSCSLPRATA